MDAPNANTQGKLEIHFTPSKKQAEAYSLLIDKEHTEIGYGGAASGGKSFLGCFWITTACLQYPGTGWIIGRRDLVNLRRTTLLTLFKLWAEQGIPASWYNYNQQNNIITFQNGSQIFLFDLARQPSDPLYTRLGGLELTGAFIDEANEVEESAINIIVTRLGRRKNAEYKLTPKLLECFNPDKGHIYQRYYRLWKENQLPAYRAFIKALPTDNPHTTPEYIDQLKSSDKITRERLLLGNFEYDDDPGTLIRYDSIMDLFTNTVDSGEKYITADIARFGADKTVIIVWNGLKAYHIEAHSGLSTDTVALKIAQLAQIERVPYSHIAIDETGVGSGVVDLLRGTKGFIAGARPLENPLTRRMESYANLKTQCIYKMAELINDHKVAVRFVDEHNGEDLLPQEMKQSLIEELEQWKAKDIDKDGKMKVRPKEEVKDVLKRSPDFSDALMMRALFEYKQSGSSVSGTFNPQLGSPYTSKVGQAKGKTGKPHAYGNFINTRPRSISEK